MRPDGRSALPLRVATIPSSVGLSGRPFACSPAARKRRGPRVPAFRTRLDSSRPSCGPYLHTRWKNLR